LKRKKRTNCLLKFADKRAALSSLVFFIFGDATVLIKLKMRGRKLLVKERLLCMHFAV
jgi:hypothetical protein